MLRDAILLKTFLLEREFEWVQYISPYKLAAVAAECGLPEESGHELVTVDLMDSSPERPATPREPRTFLELASPGSASRARPPGHSYTHISITVTSING